MGFKKSPQYLAARVTHLEMQARNNNQVPLPIGMALAIMKAELCPPHFYRYLYREIGKEHHWSVRRKLKDQQIKDIIQSDQTVIYILYISGCPAGFAELNLRNMPIAEVLYFGLIKEYQGRGLSRFFLNEVLSSAWDLDPKKLIIQTNTLDSPRALQLYQKLGFEPVSTSDVMIEAWKDD
ncbi:GNAT family N-acetyltransferase [Bartonella sp. HY329]|uniref:GNAT family N-acetyltransferase n=1 Tax=unclassified Bartonella TaxID=2645622 RepID=UPI0021C9D073|nr:MULTISPECIES: GNAT family N-acetyltransferase [unclassified Bartonella]UXM94014.1 GNAT family N-acetyltransferase [Bartonella sp. HY329]UXN08336.1 GNAT family N-acetyltransferase [Bartonella sp. HY328]